MRSTSPCWSSVSRRASTREVVDEAQYLGMLIELEHIKGDDFSLCIYLFNQCLTGVYLKTDVG